MEGKEKTPVTKRVKLPEEEIDKRIDALASLMAHWAWKDFASIIQYMQGVYASKLFTKNFMNLDPNLKDKEHRVIVEVNRVLDRLLALPQWLSKRKPSQWLDIQKHVREE